MHRLKIRCQEERKVACTRWAVNTKGPRRDPIATFDNVQPQAPLACPIARPVLSHAMCSGALISNHSTLETVRKAK